MLKLVGGKTHLCLFQETASASLCHCSLYSFDTVHSAKTHRCLPLPLSNWTSVVPPTPTTAPCVHLGAGLLAEKQAAQCVL